MGSNDGYSDERPVHSVTVPTFEMSKTAVTVDQYRACVDAGSAPLLVLEQIVTGTNLVVVLIQLIA